MTIDTNQETWEAVEQIIASNDGPALSRFLDTLGPAETARAISRLAGEQQHRLLLLLDPQAAAEVIEEVPDAQAVNLIEDLPANEAAAIVDRMSSDEQADLLGELGERDAAAILDEMTPDHAQAVRALMTYDAESAGGIMETEYLSYHQDRTLSHVLADLESNREKFAGYDVQYLYVTDGDDRLVGVLPMRELLFTERSVPLSSVMIRSPLFVRTGATLEELVEFFDRHRLFGVSVVDDSQRLVGVVRAANVEEATAKRTTRQFLGLSGIIGGEELRSMPTVLRSGRRLSWLSINIVLNVIAASVIAFYQDTLQAAITLAVFLPMISDMSGCSGNQAVAVSMREMTLGLIRPNEMRRVLVKEVGVGLINGVALGALLGGLAMLWKGNPYLGMVVGVALATNTVVAVAMGGLLPLFLKRLRLDPALVSSPILTTVTDMCGFFLVLSLATAVLPKL